MILSQGGYCCPNNFQHDNGQNGKDCTNEMINTLRNHEKAKYKTQHGYLMCVSKIKAEIIKISRYLKISDFS